jgi:peroxiredoxin
MKDKPFALISISSDPKETALKTKQRERLTWRILWDGGSTQGPITSEWQIQGWPNLYLIDSRGFIREHWTGSPATQVMDEAIDKLVKEAEAAKPDGR